MSECQTGEVDTDLFEVWGEGNADSCVSERDTIYEAAAGVFAKEWVTDTDTVDVSLNYYWVSK